MPIPAVVLFDIDGTLVRRAGPHHKHALVHAVASLIGLRSSLDGVPTQGMLDRDLLLHLLRPLELSPSAAEALLPELYAEAERYYLANCAEHLRDCVCPGVGGLLDRLTAHGATLALVTGNLRAIAYKKLELAGLAHFFPFGGFSQDGVTRAEVARVALERIKQARAWHQDAVLSLVGDHANDIAAARSNGFRAIATATGLSGREELLLCRPDVLVSNLTELTLEQVLT